MNPVEPVPTQTVDDLLRTLLARSEAAEAKQLELEQQKEAWTLKEEELKQHNERLERQNKELQQQMEALDKLMEALMKQFTSLTRRLAAAESRPEQLALQLELKAVQQKLNQLNHEKFEASSERRGRPDGAPPKPKPAPKAQTGHGPTPQPDLERVPQPHLLDDADAICPTCSPPTPLIPWIGKTSDSEEITVVERTFKICVHQRQIYQCPTCGHLETALGPEKLPGGRYSPEFAATVAADKYANGLPLSRQARIMGEQGLQVTSQTLWDQLHTLYLLLMPTYLVLHKQILESAVVFVDETRWRMMKKGGSKTWWVWVVTDGCRVFFQLVPTRGKAAARQLLQNYDGVVMADRYAVYEALEKERSRNGGRQVMLNLKGQPPESLPTPDYDLLACWMHGRRGFVKAEQLGDESATTALDLIAELYAIEARAVEQVKDIADAEERQRALLEARRVLRSSESREVIARLRHWLDTIKTLPELPLEKAVKWLNNGWEQLVRFLESPHLPLDNGFAERALRWLVVGRKTYGGSRSELGAQVAALNYTLMESCRLAGVPYREYLIKATRRALRDSQSVFTPEDYARWLLEEKSRAAAQR